MKYLTPTPNPSGAYPAPQSNRFPGAIPLTDDQVQVLVQYNGFITVTQVPDPDVEGSTVTVTPNIEAWEEWKATLPPEPEPEPEPEPTEIEQLRAQVADLQNQILTMRLGG